MQCSVTLETDCNSGNIKMKTINNYKNPYMKEPNLDHIVDQLCTRLKDIKDQESSSRVGMPTRSIDQAEAVRRYYAAFPALQKGRDSPLQYYLPPPAWCANPSRDTKLKMQSELSMSKDWNGKDNKITPAKQRRINYHIKRRNKKQINSYCKSFESKEILPEWVTHEGVWDMETQDPVKEFIRAIALDEGYGTCENTVTDELKDLQQVKIRMNGNMVPNWDDSLDFDAEWVITEDLNPKVRTPMEEELYAKFEAKFDRSIEALWSKDQNTPDDEYQDLPIDFQDLLSSPSDHLFADPSAEKSSLMSLTESIWSNDAGDAVSIDRGESPSRIADALHDRFRPLNLADPPAAVDLDAFAFYEGDDIYDAIATVAETMRSFAAINHSRDRSGFVEVPPRRIARPPPQPPRSPPVPVPAVAFATDPPEDLLTAARTHFRPIRREPDADAPRYVDGDTFDIRGDLDPVEFRRSESGGVYLAGSRERYLEYRTANTIDYGRLNLTAAQRCPDLEDPGFRLRFPLRQTDAAAQTEPAERDACEECGRAAKKMRPSDVDSIWSGGPCRACPAPAAPAPAPAADELSREWEELLQDISAAHAVYAEGGGGGGGGGGAAAGEEAGEAAGAGSKRRHSAALRCAAACTHPHARFLPCCALALAADRPLTR